MTAASPTVRTNSLAACTVKGRGSRPCGAQCGVALAIVVWFIAAMSLLVSGIVYQSRMDIKLAQLHVARAKATAAGDGAIQLMLDRLSSGQRSEGAPENTGEFILGEQRVTVRLVPVTGLVDITQIPKNVMSYLFYIPDQVDESAAQMLADSVIKWREMSVDKVATNEGLVPRLSTVEDLLRVEGITRAHLDRLIDVVYVGKGGAAVTDWSAAPPEVLALAAQSNKKAATLLADGSGDAEGRTKNNSKLTAADAYRADAFVSIGNQQWLRRRFVSMSGAESSSLPWRFFRTEPARVVPAAGDAMARFKES